MTLHLHTYCRTIEIINEVFSLVKYSTKQRLFLYPTYGLPPSQKISSAHGLHYLYILIWLIVFERKA